MRQIKYCFFMLLTVCVPPPQANCVAQELRNKFKPRVVYERDVEQAPKGHPPMYSHMYNSRKTAGGIATLTRLGTELLVNDPANSRLIVVDTKTLAESEIPLASPAVQLRTESQTDMLFLGTYVPNPSRDAILTCYESLNDLRNRKSSWSRQGEELHGLHHFQQIRWLDEHQQFIVFGRGKNPTLVLLDRQGMNLAEYELKGAVLGIDETKKGFNIFCVEIERGNWQLELTQLDNKFKLRKTQRLPVIDRPQNPISWGGVGITENFRLRGLKSGEVTKYFLEIASQSGYLEMRGRLPIDNLSSRFYYANKLSAAESSLQPEIIVGVARRGRNMSPDGFVLFDQQTNYYYEPDQWLKDAIFDEQRKMIVTVADSKKPEHWKVRLISFE